VLHGKTKFFSGRGLASIRFGDVVRDAIVLDNARVIDGQIGGTVGKFGSDGITAGLHRAVDEMIHTRESPARVIHESSLRFTPFGCKAFTFRFR